MTMFALRTSRRIFILTSLAVAVAVAVAFIAGVAVFATSSEDERHLQRSAIGEARKTASNDIVVQVNGYPITEADILEAREPGRHQPAYNEGL